MRDRLFVYLTGQTRGIVLQCQWEELHHIGALTLVRDEPGNKSKQRIDRKRKHRHLRKCYVALVIRSHSESVIFGAFFKMPDGFITR